jgi:hypothetical protein
MNTQRADTEGGAIQTLRLCRPSPLPVGVEGRPVRLETRTAAALLALLSLGYCPQPWPAPMILLSSSSPESTCSKS